MTRFCLVLSVALVLALVPAAWSAPQTGAVTTAAQTPGSRLITYTGTLTDAEGRARTGSVTLVFSLYAQQDGNEALWRERQTVAANELGRYTVLLGATVPGGVPPEAFGDGKAQWLGVAVDGEAEQPRALLVAVPYAMKAADADTLGGKPMASFVLSSDLEKAVEKQVTSVTTTSGGGAGVVSGGTIGTLGSEAGSSTWYGQYAANAGGGSDNAFFGQYAGYAAIGVGYNAFFGQGAGQNTTTGSNNAFLGRSAGSANTTGHSNVFVGTNAGQSNTTSSNNTFVGRAAGNNNTAAGNSFFGYHSGYNNTTGDENVFIGFQTGAANTTGVSSTYVGYQAGVVSTGDSNTFVGALAGSANTSGGDNTFVGRGAGEATTTGYDNTAIGLDAGHRNTTGTGNTFLGFFTGASNTQENGNTFVGTGSNGTAGITNATAIGNAALVTQSNSLVLGSTSVSVGIGTTAPTARLHVAGDVKMGDYLTGPNNVVMGSGTALPTWSGNVELNNEVGVGFHFRALTTKFDIGPGAGGAPTYPGLLTLAMDGKVGIGTSSPAYKLHVAGDIYTTGTYQGSDLRLKDQVRDLRYGLGEVLQLRPVSYRWKDAALAQPTLGLIAQEVEPVLPELVAHGTDEAGLLSLNYTGLIPVLVKAVQEQEARISDQHRALARKDAEIAALRTDVLATRTQKDAEIAALRAEVAAGRARSDADTAALRAEAAAARTRADSEMAILRAEGSDLRLRLAALEEQLARLLRQQEPPQPH